MTRTGLVATLAAMITAGVLNAEVRLLDYSDLHDWERDNHDEALSVFRETCRDLDDGDWPTICALSETQADARTFFETFFRPVLITDGDTPLFTGYFEPELLGSRTPTARFNIPLYRRPEEALQGRWLTREQIESSSILENRGLELVWVEHPVDKFFLQIQGSGRIKLTDGTSMRLGYGGKNGHIYRSVGQELVRRGIFEPHQVSAQVIRNWVTKNPDEGQRLLFHNPSYVFFRDVTEQVPVFKGPLGAMNRPITALRSIAIDPEFVPLGAPVWVEKEGAEPFRHLMIAQDTGSAIKGAQRADIFYGSGDKAGEIAGRVRDTGRMIVLLPIEDALVLID